MSSKLLTKVGNKTLFNSQVLSTFTTNMGLNEIISFCNLFLICDIQLHQLQPRTHNKQLQ